VPRGARFRIACWSSHQRVCSRIKKRQGNAFVRHLRNARIKGGLSVEEVTEQVGVCASRITTTLHKRSVTS
jgi:hypothetical protein